MTTLTIAELFTPVSSDGWQAQLLANANTLQLKTTSWEEGSPSLTIIEIVSALMSQEDGLISLIAQGGFLDFAATGTVTYTAANGVTITVPVTPDPSDPSANPTGAPGWLDLLASSSYDVTRIGASFATGAIAIGNTAASTLTYAVGTYHVENPTTGATYKNAAAMSVPQGTAIGGGITAVTNGAPIVVTTASAHGRTNGDSIVISDVVGANVAGVFAVTVISPTSLSLNGTDGTTIGAYVSGGVARTTSAITISADVAGTGGTSNQGAITQAVTTNAGVYVANPSAIVGQGYETNVQLAARCRARLAALSPNGPKGAYQYFALSAADILGNASNPLFVAPAVTIPAITRTAIYRNSGTGVVTVVVASSSGAVGGVTNLPITVVAPGTPITITTGSAHGLSTGDVATVSGVLGTTIANGTWIITVTSATTFTLNGSAGGATYLGGGVVEGGVLGEVDRVIQSNAIPDTVTEQTVSAVNMNVAILATVQVPVANVATYAVAVQQTLALFNAALPIGGVDGVYPINDVIGALYAAGIAGGSSSSYVRRIDGVALNGTVGDLAFPGTTSVASLSPAPVINVVGV